MPILLHCVGMKGSRSRSFGFIGFYDSIERKRIWKGQNLSLRITYISGIRAEGIKLFCSVEERKADQVSGWKNIYARFLSAWLTALRNEKRVRWFSQDEEIAACQDNILFKSAAYLWTRERVYPQQICVGEEAGAQCEWFMNKASGFDFIKMGMGAFCTLKRKNIPNKRRIVDAPNYMGLARKRE